MHNINGKVLALKVGIKMFFLLQQVLQTYNGLLRNLQLNKMSKYLRANYKSWWAHFPKEG